MARERNEPAGIERALKAAMKLSPTDLGKVCRHLDGPKQPPDSLATMAYIEETYRDLSVDGRAYLSKKLKALHEIVQPQPATTQPATTPENGTQPS